MTYKIIKDAFGKVKHWYISENEFVFNYTNYERDEYTSRCYYLEDSKCLRADCDGKLVKRRISAKEYAELLEKCKAECTELETKQIPVREAKVEWCENFIKSVFEKMPEGITGIETNCFWKKAEESGLWVRGTYGTPMSKALENLTKVDVISDEKGTYLYSVFRLV